MNTTSTMTADRYIALPTHEKAKIVGKAIVFANREQKKMVEKYNRKVNK